MNTMLNSLIGAVCKFLIYVYQQFQNFFLIYKFKEQLIYDAPRNLPRFIDRVGTLYTRIVNNDCEFLLI